MADAKKVSDSKCSFTKSRGQTIPLGVSKTNAGINFSVCVKRDQSCALVLYQRGERQPFAKVALDVCDGQGDVRAVELAGLSGRHLEYVYEIDGQEVPDPYARCIYGTKKYGETPQYVRCGIPDGDYDWEDDRAPAHPLSDVIAYNLHVRGFTKDVSSKVKKKGTFGGIIEKIPYLCELGVNQIELMPAYEFPELYSDPALMTPEITKKNYWGYGPALFFAPKASYAASDRPCTEFKDLVKACHRSGIELVMEFYFPEHTSLAMIADCLRYWVMEYHVDGFHINALPTGYMSSLAVDPILSATKLYASDFPDLSAEADAGHLARYHDGFSGAMRRILKGDEDQLHAFMYYLCEHPQDTGVIHYITSHNGFTLCDLVSYDQKHNEDNHQNNCDGSDFNFSWNCGQEGRSRKRKVLALRRKQMKNALALLLFSQGTPMLLAGDECGNSQEGNNNPYCHDSKLTLVQWNNAVSKEMQPFVRKLIALRKRHPILHSAEPLKSMDVNGNGYPDVSFHSDKAWYVEMEPYRRHVGVMYCASQTDFLYVAFNFHWLSHDFALPYLPSQYVWKMLMDTSVEGEHCIEEPENAVSISDQRKIVVPERTVVLLIAQEREPEQQEK